jgi:DNA-binding NarL/FixJ family response regulator
LTGLARLRADPGARAVARLVAEGLTNREIGERLGLTVSQAKARVRSWFEATGLDGRELLGVWVTAGGLDRPDARSAREAGAAPPP